MERIPITPKGYAKLEKEIDYLKNVERPNIIKSIQVARDFGDLSENADYSTAKEKQSFIEGRIKDMEHLQSKAEIIRHRPESSSDNPELSVSFGARVTLKNVNNNNIIAYTLVGDYEANINQNLISISSPLAKAMIGFIQDDIIEIENSGKKYMILKIEHKAEV